MIAMRRGWMLVSVLLALLTGCAECAVAQGPLAVTTVQDTVYTASGATASGTVLVSWPGFTTASGAVVPAGTTSATIGTSGLLSITLAPNAGATPIGSFYTATFHLSDGSTSRQYWVIPVSAVGGAPVRLAAIQNEVLPTSVAMQTVSKTYVDMAIAAAVTGHPADSSTPYVLKAGDTMTGPLVVPTINTGTLNATTVTGSMDGASITSGTVNAARLPVFNPSGSTHASGIVPDPGATAGATRYLREDGTWDAPPGGTVGGSGTMATQNANAVAITGGTITGATVTGPGLPTGCVQLPCMVASVTNTATNTSVYPAVTLYTVPASPGAGANYGITCSLTTSIAGSGAYTIYASWTDVSGTAHTGVPLGYGIDLGTVGSSNGISGTTLGHPSTPIDAAAGTAITYDTQGYGSGTYIYSCQLELTGY